MKNIEHTIKLTKVLEDYQEAYQEAYQEVPGGEFEMFNGELYRVQMDKELRRDSKEYFAILNGIGIMISNLKETSLSGNKITLNIKLE